MKSGDNRPDGEGTNPFAGMRKDFRTPFTSTAYIALGESAEGADSWIRTEVLDLSLGGARMSFNLDEETSKDLTGTVCTVKFSLKGEDRMFPGQFAWVSSGSSETEGANGTCEAGIRFEDLSMDDKSDLVSLFMWTTLEKNSQ